MPVLHIYEIIMITSPTIKRGKKLNVLKKDVLDFFPVRENEPDTHVIRSALASLVKPVCFIVSNNVYGVTIEKIERGTHYIVSFSVDEKFLLTDDHEALLQTQKPDNLRKCALTFTQVISTESNYLRIDVQRIQCYNILT